MLIHASWDPIIFQWGPFTLGWHGVFTALAVIVAIWFGVRLSERIGVPGSALEPAIIALLVGGVIGARVLHILDHLPYYLAHPAEMVQVWNGGIAVYGAFIGGIVGGIIAVWGKGLPIWRLLDVAAPSMLIGQAIGRLGCFSNGDAWGAPTGGSWGVVYENPNDLLPANLIGVPTHPYPLYEIAADLALLAILWLIWGRVKAPGAKFAIAAVGYAAIRFFLTFFRQEPILFLGLQEAQVFAIITGIVGFGLLWFRLSRAPVASEPAYQPSTESSPETRPQS